jgi:hypothetical protein
VQPFAIREEAADLSIDWGTSPEEDYRFDELARLSVLSNVDKHRRLPLLAWYADFVYWLGEPNCWSWRPGSTSDLAPRPRCRDRPHGSHGDGTEPPPEATIEVNPALADDPALPHSLVQTLERWHQYLVSWVLPRMFAVADGNPPPILITGPPA